MSAKIYSVFPACGKTWLFDHQEELGLKILDSDSSQFSWMYVGDEKVRNPDFPRNYIEHIKSNIDKYDYIFVSTHSSVREALDKENISFALVFPRRRCKAEWVGRCFIREQNGESGCGAKAMFDNWDLWIDDCEKAAIYSRSLMLDCGEYFSEKLINWADIN